MKRLLCVLIISVLLLLAAGCAGKDKNTFSDNMDQTASPTQTAAQVTSTPTPAAVSTPVPSIQTSPTTENPDLKNTVLLQSASVDLDADGINEQVEVLQAEAEDPAQADTVELEGILRIDGKNGRTDTVYIKKSKGAMGVLNSIEFSDLDGDGAKDVLITFPDAGAAFLQNYYFIYNYKSDKSYNFTIDASLNDFTDGFQFIYKGKGILQMKNDGYGFSADFDITSKSKGNGPDDEINQEYERAWVEASPVVISENSKIALRQAGGKTAIKVPLPVFGLAAADMIGEIDMYFNVGSDFKPVMTSFEVYDFDDAMTSKKIGEWKRS